MRAIARRRQSRTLEETKMKANLSTIPAKHSTATLVEHFPRRGDAALLEPLPSLSHILSLLLLWQERVHTRRQLRELDEHTLRDIGLSRGEALYEAAKPFWR
jgi:uncharacterized protein YjiS (DUF1127 family)